jgi:hypothetical protein
MSRASVLLMCAATALGCGKKREQAAADTPVETPAGVSVLRDSAPVATVAIEGEQPLANVTELGPASEWRLVTARGEGGRELYIRDPAREYAAHTIKLYRGPKGRPTVGVFRDSMPSASDRLAGLGAAPVIFLAGVVSIDVRTKEEELPEIAASSLELRVPGGGGVIALDSKRLASLPAIKPPDQREGSTGWLLKDVIGAGHPIDGAPAVQLVDGSGTAVDVPAGALTDPTQILFMKLNRRGQFRFKWWRLTGAPPSGSDPGKAPKNVAIVAELRGVQRIDVR